MVLPLVVGAVVGFGGWLAGKSGSGGGIEIGTSKKTTQTTDSRQTTYTSQYSPTINKSFDFARNYALGGSSITTKKESSVSQEPNLSQSVIPSLTTTPTSNQGGGGSAGTNSKEAFDFTGIALIGAVGLGAFLILSKDKGAKK